MDAVLEDGYQLVFPLTSLLETGNHIANAPHGRYDAANRFSSVLADALVGTVPWTPFAEQVNMLGPSMLESICVDWPAKAAAKVSIGDFLITAVADYYSRASMEVRILSSDAALRSYVPAVPLRKPRRRTGRG